MIEKKNSNINKGAVILSLIFVLLFFLLIGRYFYLGWTGKAEGVDLEKWAEKKWTKSDRLDANRGTIYDRNGKAIAEDIPSYTVIAILNEDYSNHIEDPAEAASKLAPILNMSESRLRDLMSRDAFQVELGPGGNKISHSKMEEIKALEIKGIDFNRETKRHYPNQDFASHIIGFATNDEDGNRKGAMGLEKALDKYLQEQDGMLKYQSDGEGLKLPDPKEVIKEPKHGASVYLTIDEKIQLFLEKAMNNVDEEYHPKRMIGIVADPKTGQILAMSNRPSFNPNVRDITNYTNYAVSSAFEPGSTMKIFTLATAIEEGVYNGNAEYQSGVYKTKYEKYRDHNSGRGWGKISYNEGVRKSSNVAFAKIAKEQLGFEKLYEYINERWEFDEKTGINIPGEGKPIIQDRYESDKITTAFGQGSAITPIQQIQAATAIANGGKMMKPYVIEKMVDPSTKKAIQNAKPTVVGEPISSDTAKEVRDLLRTVVTEGTGKNYDIDGYDVAGKTGTAQLWAKEDGVSSWDNYMFSFLGMAPADDPKLLVYVAIDRPDLEDGRESGSVPVSKVFNPVMKGGLQYLNINPEESSEKSEASIKGVEVADLVGESSISTKRDLEEKGLNVHVFGQGDQIISQAPYAGTKLLKGERVFLKTKGKVKMPDLTGMSRSEVLRLAKALDLKTPEFTGNGYVSLQSLAKGATVKEGAPLVVELKSPQELKEMEDVPQSDKKEKKNN
ncbi:penicillin-binding protein [Pseudalkalibacillus berkeleyi]|uniref:PASTA domain-containing protein n=1 Tax=Pseudalkalibacillus berkeleyi TaxID=1069813 RepID=A0ABS9GW18_9BACL|nr:penicillin-binding protein [Pseudalkalibacillus berkeleyi]MCF6137008.1 PASTA domain-containing protein [Pseudalkalibacillus berkeleyi]